MAWTPIPHTSLQYVGVDVTALQAGVSQDPTSDDVKFAFMDAGTDIIPDTPDFSAATWETNSTTTPPTYTALCLIGPGGTVELDPGDYKVYVQITDSPEVPIIRVPGTLVIF